MHASYGIMALIFVLFAVCGYIFFWAQEIDRGKGSVELFQEVQQAKKLHADLIKALEAELEGSKREAFGGQRTTLDVLNVLSLLGEANTKLRVMEEKERLMVETGYSTDVDSVNSKEELTAQGRGITAYQKTLRDFLDGVKKRFDTGEVTQTDIAQTERFLQEANLRQSVNEQKAKHALSAVQIKNSGVNVDTLSLVGTSLIRFGGVAVTLFLMAVLVPVYRYNVRLSTYYLARADALLLCKDVLVPNFTELAGLLTPSIVFDKEPRTPVDAVSSIVKDAAGLVKKV
jgi:hypothetical protein